MQFLIALAVATIPLSIVAQQPAALCAPGSKPFTMTAEFHSNDKRVHAAPGAYAVVWVAPDKWRREFKGSSPVYREVRNGASIYVQPKEQWPWSSRAVREILPGCFDDVTPPVAAENDGLKYGQYEQFHGALIAKSGTWDTHQEEFTITKLEDLGEIDERLFTLAGCAEESVAEARAVLIEPHIIRSVGPMIPDQARARNLSGEVRVKLTVNTQGRVENLRVDKSSDPMFDEAALDAVKQYLFAPATRDGVPVARDIAIDVNFHMY